MALGSGNLPFPLKGKGEGSNQKGSNQKNPAFNNNGAFPGGGAGKRKSSNDGKALAPGS